MTLEQLRIFVAVARSEHVTRAAASLSLSQSAVSASVAALETAHSVKLFHRVGRRIELTSAGAMFLDEADAVLAHARAAELALADLGSVARGMVRVHASQTVASYWLPPRLVALRQRFPQVQVEFSVGNTTQVAAAVQSGAADLGVVEAEVDLPELVRRKVATDDLVMIVRPDHPWVRLPQVGAADLVRTTWVVREPGSGTRAEFEDALRAIGIALDGLDILLELPSNEAVVKAVEAGAGAAVISRLAAGPGLQAGRLHAIGFELPARDFIVLWHRERYRTKAADALLSILS